MVTSKDFLRRERLRNQRLVRSELRTPAEVVASLGAVQAQDYAGAKWALGLRINGITDPEVEKAFNAGTILRTHILRPTWHFVPAADLRWMVNLSGPRVNAGNGYMYQRLELDAPSIARSRRVLERALRDDNFLTRTEIAAALRRRNIVAAGQRLAYIMMRAELDGVVCSGPRHGKQFTYALSDERVREGRTLDREQALAELTRRYFTSHGPATLKDYMWWSGLRARDARAGMEATRLEHITINGLSYWFVPNDRAVRLRSPLAWLLPNYDEYGIAYRDRGPVVEPTQSRPLGPASEFPHLLVIDGRWRGSWRRTLQASTVRIDLRPHQPLTREEKDAVEAAGDRYARFLGVAPRVTFLG